MLKMQSGRACAYAECDFLRIKLISDVIADNNNDDNWIYLRSNEDVDNLEFDIEEFFVKVEDESELEMTISEINAKYKELKGDKKAKKDAEKTSKAKKTSNEVTE